MGESTQLVERVQDLQAQLDGTAESGTRELAEELVSAVVQMYGVGLERIVESLHQAGAAARGSKHRSQKTRWWRRCS